VSDAEACWRRSLPLRWASRPTGQGTRRQLGPPPPGRCGVSRKAFRDLVRQGSQMAAGGVSPFWFLFLRPGPPTPALRQFDEAAIKREARLSAIEFMIGELCSAFYRDLPATAIHARHDQLCAAIAGYPRSSLQTTQGGPLAALGCFGLSPTGHRSGARVFALDAETVAELASAPRWRPVCAHMGHSAALAYFSRAYITSARAFDHHGWMRLYGEPLPSDSDRQGGAACKALSSFIIAGNTAFAHKGRPANMGQRKLGYAVFRAALAVEGASTTLGSGLNQLPM
jgi:hypothetical protein